MKTEPTIALDKMGFFFFFNPKVLIFFLSLNENIHFVGTH